MKAKAWIAAGALAVALAVGGVAAAAGPGGVNGPAPGNGQGYGYGPANRGAMMGHGGMMGRGGMMGAGPMMGAGICDGTNYDPAAMLTHMESMLAQHKTLLADLEAQLAAATDDSAKTFFTARIERQKLMIGFMESRIAELKAEQN